MKKLRKASPIWVSIVLVLLYPAVNTLSALALQAWDGVWNYGDYLGLLIVELLTLLAYILLTLLLRMGYVFRPGGRGVGKCLLPMLPVLLLYTYSMLMQFVLCSGEPVEPPLRIVWFVLCMLAIGLTEELVFRGLITRMMFEKYGRNALGVWLTVLVSSLLFGAVHLINAIGGAASIGSVLIQIVGAMALGMCLSATYLRTNSLWTVALIHGYMDFCALVPSGVFALVSMWGQIDEGSVLQLVAALVYVLLAMFLLRPAKMKEIIGGARKTASQGDVVKLMLAVLLATGLFSAVTALSV